MPLFAITNFGADTWAMFRPTFPLLDHFGDIVVSGIEKVAKPDPRIYDLAAQPVRPCARGDAVHR